MSYMAGARPKSITPSVYKGSEEVVECPCTPCARQGAQKEAANFCTDCAEYFCSACTNDHTKFGITAAHKVVDKTKAQQTRPGKNPATFATPAQLPTERCKEHSGELITNFCKDHDLVVCNSCATIDHRTCESVVYIPKISGTPKTRQTVPKVRDEVIASIKAVKAAKVNLQKRTPINDGTKAKHLATIKNHTQRIIDHARDMETAAVADVNRRHQETANNTEMAQLDDSEAGLQQRLDSLDNAHSNNDSQVFVDLKLGRREAVAANKLEQHLQSSGGGNLVRSTFVLDDGVDVFVNDVNSLGKVEVNKPIKAVLKGSYDVKHKGDGNVCDISDCCELTNGDILITDYYHNKCIKVLNTSKTYKVSKRFKTTSAPWGICQTSKSEIVVTLTIQKKVQFVDISGSWRLASSFKMEEACRGITARNNELYISCGGLPGEKNFPAEAPGFVAIVDMSGSMRRKVQLDGRGRQLFSMPRDIVTTHNGKKIHIADKTHGVITIDPQGNVLSKFSDKIEYAFGLCAVGSNDLLLAGYRSNNLVQMKTDGELVAEVLGEKDGLEEPLSVMYSPTKSILIVTFNISNEIKVFNLQV